MKLVLRMAVPSDVPLILELVRELATFEKLLDQVEATEERLREALFPVSGGRPTAECLLAEADGVSAGFALFFTNFSTFLSKPGLYLEDLFVRPEWRGRGIGRTLLLRLAKLANERGCGRMEWAVLDWNTDAIAFYHTLGAEPQGDWTIFRLTGQALKRYA